MTTQTDRGRSCARDSLRRGAVAGLVFICWSLTGRSADPAAVAAGFFQTHCITCHDPDSPKGGLDLTKLPWNSNDPKNFEHWVRIYDRVEKQEMPPAKVKERPSGSALEAFLNPLREHLLGANLAKQHAEGRVTLRRLNRNEYENTLHDLLGIDLPLKHLLPEDEVTSGFDNVAEGLRLSSLHLGQFLEAAEAAIAVALDLRPKPVGVKRRFRYQEDQSIADEQKQPPGTPRMFKVLPDAVVVFDENSPTALRQYIYDTRGQYRIRIAAATYQAAGRPAWLRLYSTDFKTKRLLGYFDLPAVGSREIEIIANLEAGELLDLKPTDTNYDPSGAGVFGRDANSYGGRGIAIQWVDVEGPLMASWPPPSVGRLLGDLPVKPVESAVPGRAGPAYKIVTTDPRPAVAKVLQNFMPRAFRRPITAAEGEPFIKLAQSALADGQSLEAAIKLGLRAVLTSPEFLFLDERPGKLGNWALAARLSYFLWNTCPDDQLRELAAEGELQKSAILHGEVERHLNSPKAITFIENFTDQWLDLRQIDFTQPDPKLYPEFDDILKASMLGETRAFFAELLRGDLSLTNFIHSDFLMLNRALAEHYGIPDVPGEEFRRSPSPVGRNRGGILTHASVLKVSANGNVTSPVLRGAWVAKRLLGEPLPPPPADVPTFEPDTRGSTTIREQLAKHRSSPVCASCHTRMDPPGFALENFDVLGGWRTRYRAEKGEAPPWKFRGRGIWEYKLGARVDASGEMPDGRKFLTINEFKNLLLDRQEQVARNLTQNLLTYATGAAVQFSDRTTVEAILKRGQTPGVGLRTLVHEIVQSPVFQNK